VEGLSDHRVLVPDRAGYGRSGDETLGIAENADVLADLLVERDAVPATIVGHSYGGGVAILLAVRRPELVSGLVLVGSVGQADSLTAFDRVLAAPFAGEGVAAMGLLALGRVLPALRTATGSGGGAVRAWLRASLPDDHYSHVSSQRGRKVWRSFVAEQRSLLREIGGVEAALGEVSVPTVVVSGAWDVVVPRAVSARIAAAIPGAELVSVPGVGHFVPRDAPEVVVDAITRVEQLAARGGEEAAGGWAGA
jgi:pimeloyl-ACP methyl ester carboxylesterase